MGEIPLEELTGHAVTPLGHVSIVPRGDYSPEATYYRLHAVVYDYNGYVALKDNLTGVSPEDETAWALLVSSGSAELAKLYSDQAKASADRAAASEKVVTDNKAALDAVKDNLDAIQGAPDAADRADAAADRADAAAERAGQKAQEIADGDFVTHGEVGAEGGVASLDASKKVPSQQLPVAGGTIGGVKSGGDITVAADGTVSVNDDSHSHEQLNAVSSNNTTLSFDMDANGVFIMIKGIRDDNDIQRYDIGILERGQAFLHIFKKDGTQSSSNIYDTAHKPTPADIGALAANGKAVSAGTADKVANALTFTGGSTDVYDGSKAIGVKIPNAPGDVGAAAASHTHGYLTSVNGNTGPAVNFPYIANMNSTALKNGSNDYFLAHDCCLNNLNELMTWANTDKAVEGLGADTWRAFYNLFLDYNNGQFAKTGIFRLHVACSDEDRDLTTKTANQQKFFKAFFTGTGTDIIMTDNHIRNEISILIMSDYPILTPQVHFGLLFSSTGLYYTNYNIWHKLTYSTIAMREVQSALLAAQINSLSVDDETALRWYSLYPEWSAGTEYAAGHRARHGDRLYKCRQGHTSQAGWEPENTPALWEEIPDSHKGTRDDPIQYHSGMALESGKYYTEEGVLYRCIRDTGTPVYNPLAELIDLYVEAAE